jgi:hypothetical protein
MITKQRRRARSQKHLVIFALLALTLAIGLVSFQNLRRSLTPAGINEVSYSQGQVTLTLSPVTLTTNPGQEQTLTLMMNTGSAKVTAVKGELTYDTARMGTPTLSQGTFLTERLKDSSVGSGRISFVYAAPPDSGGKSGSGTLATIKIKPTVSGDTKIAITSSTEVAALGYPANVLKSGTDASIQVTTPAASSSPAASTSPHASASPSPSSLASARASASPVASASPTNTASPSPSASASSVVDTIKDFFTGRTSPTPAPSSATESEVTQVAGKPTFTEFVFGGTKTAVDDTTGEEVAVREPNILERIVSFFRSLFGLS